MYVISKTGSGKSAAPLSITTLRCGITIVLVPLLGLGSDQVKKASREERGIRAYHVDEHRGPNGVLLRDWLMNMTDDECETSTTILFISPQSLSDHVNPKTNINVPSPWLTKSHRAHCVLPRKMIGGGGEEQERCRRPPEDGQSVMGVGVCSSASLTTRRHKRGMSHDCSRRRTFN